jgi:threonine 3-dehydrogenase
MSGHPGSLELAIEHTRPGGRISLLGLYSDRLRFMDMNKVIFKGLQMNGIVGRKIWETWDQMDELFTKRGLDLTPIVTHEMHFTEVEKAMQTLKRGEAGKIVLSFE